MNDPHRDTSETFAPDEGERLHDDPETDLAAEAAGNDPQADLEQDAPAADDVAPVVVGEADDAEVDDEPTSDHADAETAVEETAEEPIEGAEPEAPEPAEEPGETVAAESAPTEPADEPEETFAAESASAGEAEQAAEPEEEAEATVPEPVVAAPAAEPESAEEPETIVRDPFRGPGEWYVVHTYAGYENKVKTNLESRIHTMQMEEKIFDVHIPMEDVMEIKGGKKQVVQRKVFPGYLLVKMIYDNDSWYVVRNTPGVTGFVAAGTGSKPTPLSKREVEKILAVKKEEVKPQFRLGFEEGDVVRIISGPFADFNGTISEINIDQSKLKVLVNIFDRETPVELSFDQVAKV
jgi:transcription termination/antitermination protein NusG